MTKQPFLTDLPLVAFATAKRQGHNPEAYLTDVLERLPAMTNQDDLSVLLASNWQPAAAATAPNRATCPA